jgi:hypothetical protein
MCQLGSQISACGKSGIACKACSVSESCDFGTCRGTFGGTGGGFSGTGGGNVGGGNVGGGNVGGGNVGGGNVGGGNVGGGNVGGGNVGGGNVGGGNVGGGNVGGGNVGGGNAGETCSNPLPMTPVSATEFSALGSIDASSTDDHAGTCGGAGRDLAYGFTVSTTSDVRFSLSSIGGVGPPVGYLLRDDCTSEVACYSGTSMSPVTRLAPGNYRLIVDALMSGSVGPFTASVLLTPVTPQAGDTCSTAQALTVGVTVSGTTDGYASDHLSPTCNTNGADRYYRFTLASSATVTAEVVPISSSAYFGVYVLGPSTSCATASETTCRVSMTGGVSTTTSAALGAGTYYLVVKNLSSSPGGFTLLTSTPTTVPGDSCSTAVPLTFSGGSAAASGTIIGAGNDRSASCATSSGDVVYSFTVTSPSTFSATATPTSGSWRPVVTVFSGTSCTSAVELGCGLATTAGGSATLSNIAVSPGTYFLWVDSVSTFGVGAFSLTATLTPGGTGDTCSAPLPLTFSGGSATVSGSTSGLLNDNASTCVVSSGPDVVYSFNATAGQAFAATLTPSGFQGHLVLRGSAPDCSSATELTCQLGASSGSTVTLTRSSLSAGTYYLWVDGVNGGAGSYSLNATLGTVSTGENCSTAIPLVFSGTTATGSGTTSGAVSDRSSSSCGGSGGDRVYSFTVSGTRTFSLTVTPTGTSYYPVLYVTSASQCTTTSDLRCIQGAGAGSTTSLTGLSLTTGTYYLWLDSFSSSTGPYSFTATLN